MKRRHLITGTVITMLALGVQAQQSAPSAQSAPSVTPQTQPPAAPTGANDSGLFSSNQVGRFRTNMQSLGTNLSAFGTNAYTHMTNGWTWLSNRFRGTNLSPTGGITNRMYGTNGISTTNGASLQMRDDAVTPADQTRLLQIRQRVRPLFLTGNSRQGLIPVHFVCRNNVVTIVGFVPSEEQKEKVVSLVQGTPGVIQVVDNLQVSAAGGTAGSESQFSETTSTASQPVVSQDQAFTSSDRNILIQVRQTVEPIIGNSSPWMPVHFITQDGVVTLVGFVPSEQQKQQIFQAVQQTPGVVQVINQLQVNTTLGASGSGSVSGTNHTGMSNSILGVNSTNLFGGASTNTFGVTSTNAVFGTNNFGLSQTNVPGTNLAPTGRTNTQRMFEDRDQDQDQNSNLPPGLRKRENLPPGLQREDLPPGLERRTNAPPSNDSR